MENYLKKYSNSPYFNKALIKNNFVPLFLNLMNLEYNDFSQEDVFI